MNSDYEKLLDRVRYVPRHVAHHGAYSGYDRLFEYMGLQVARSASMVRIADWLPGGLQWRLWNLRPQATQQVGLVAELGALPWLSRGKGRLCHFIYGEDTFFYSSLWRKRGNKVIATFHYPPDTLVERVNPGVLRSLDAVVIVGENQREYFRRFFSDEKIVYCPHHVDTEFFRPGYAADETSPFRMICVGQLLRDYGALAKIHRAVRENGVNCETIIVGPASLNHHAIANEPGVTIHSGVGDEDFVALYQSASLGVLPLIDATANNSLLEMLSCGLPVVVSPVGGVPQYVHGSSVDLVNREDINTWVETICSYATNADRRIKHGAENRVHAERVLSKETLGNSMFDVYDRILSAT